MTRRYTIWIGLLNAYGAGVDLPRKSGHMKGYNLKTLEVSDAREKPEAVQP